MTLVSAQLTLETYQKNPKKAEVHKALEYEYHLLYSNIRCDTGVASKDEQYIRASHG